MIVSSHDSLGQNMKLALILTFSRWEKGPRLPVREETTSLWEEGPPLPLGEGWGEGLSRIFV